MNSNFGKIQSFFSAKRIIIPILIGLSVALFFVLKDFDVQVFKAINFNFSFWTWIFLALVFVAIRDIAYMVRLRMLTDKKLNWLQSFQVIMLWEFASSLTPSVVGGSAIAMFIINQENISLGRSTAIVMITAIFDELFYIVSVPFFLLMAGFSNVFVKGSLSFIGMQMNVGLLFLIGYFFIVLLVLILSYGVFFRPYQMRYILVSIFSIGFLKRWKFKATRTGNEIIIASREYKDKTFFYWLKLFGITFASWTSRFLVVNSIIAAVSMNTDHILVFARQLVMWVILLISPTPGGTGIAEFFFPVFLKEFIPSGLAPALALLWRVFSYYPYIFIGIIVLPIWFRRILKRKKSEHE
ncbi:MAG: lysylphosphatidylglycerol synthase transmembrane domain-containing protein [Bacteroidales bacterium]|nr:lysylphosphatidylglycerol synthase transmembrane domain-containing protein [Bacteroidales bacterium]